MYLHWSKWRDYSIIFLRVADFRDMQRRQAMLGAVHKLLGVQGMFKGGSALFAYLFAEERVVPYAFLGIQCIIKNFKSLFHPDLGMANANPTYCKNYEYIW